MQQKRRNKAGEERRRMADICAIPAIICRYRALYEVCAPPGTGMNAREGSDDGGMMVRPQGGGGVDHLAKVQQNKAQTDTHFSYPRGYSYPQKGMFSCIC